MNRGSRDKGREGICIRSTTLPFNYLKKKKKKTPQIGRKDELSGNKNSKTKIKRNKVLVLLLTQKTQKFEFKIWRLLLVQAKALLSSFGYTNPTTIEILSQRPMLIIVIARRAVLASVVCRCLMQHQPLINLRLAKVNGCRRCITCPCVMLASSFLPCKDL